MMSAPAITKDSVKKGGRPDQGRCKPVTVRFTSYEHQQLMQAVQESGKSASDLIRETAAGIAIKARPAPITKDLLRELSAWGNNFNQLAFSCNKGGVIPSEILDVLSKCYIALSSIEQRVLGEAGK